ncbi:WXG100 family type VII secretion target [Micromonospora sp. NBRC 110038]|uniref:WXG100 family type VII secretion target n=1 Tax=Micromonospora sp. NBRC 110038 TaxID=1550034 RepID=UPI0027DFC21D|nr:WXG100 family type VII secretion target [Micromonospora sp. NBRC 110038]
MTMPVVQTNEPGMQQAAQEFASRAEEFTTHLRNVNDQMGMLQASWTGEASAQFNSAMDAWENAFQKVINELLTIMEAMGVNTRSYSAAEDEASSTAASFAQALPGF